MIIVSSLFAAAWGMASQPYLWRLARWLGDYLSVSDAVWQATFVGASLLPVLVPVLLIKRFPAVSANLYKGRMR